MKGTPVWEGTVNPAMPQSPYEGAKDGDIYYNPVFGDYWLVQNGNFVLLNDRWEVPLSVPVGFKKVGHIKIGGDAE